MLAATDRRRGYVVGLRKEEREAVVTGATAVQRASAEQSRAAVSCQRRHTCRKLVPDLPSSWLGFLVPAFSWNFPEVGPLTPAHELRQLKLLSSRRLQRQRLGMLYEGS
jgi:hypothetical protein